MTRHWLLALCILTMGASGGSSAAVQKLISGVDLEYVDKAVRPQDDLYRHLNGKWLDSFQIPADKGSYGSFSYLYDITQEQLRSIIEGLGAAGKANGAGGGGGHETARRASGSR